MMWSSTSAIVVKFVVEGFEMVKGLWSEWLKF